VRLDPASPTAEELEDPDHGDSGFDDPSPTDVVMEPATEPEAEQPQERPRWESVIDDLLEMTAEHRDAQEAFLEGPEHGSHEFVNVPREVPTPGLAHHTPVDARSEASDATPDPDEIAMIVAQMFPEVPTPGVAGDTPLSARATESSNITEDPKGTAVPYVRSVPFATSPIPGGGPGIFGFWHL
jgi:hypothetical protein